MLTKLGVTKNKSRNLQTVKYSIAYQARSRPPCGASFKRQFVPLKGMISKELAQYRNGKFFKRLARVDANGCCERTNSTYDDCSRSLVSPSTESALHILDLRARVARVPLPILRGRTKPQARGKSEDYLLRQNVTFATANSHYSKW